MSDGLPILVKVWGGTGTHRYRYIRRSLPSLLASDLPAGTTVIISDDQSDDTRVTKLLETLARSDSRVRLWRNITRLGPNGGQAVNFPRMVQEFPDADAFGLCDDDVVYARGWLQRVREVMREANAKGIQGIFSAFNVPIRPARSSVLLPSGEVLLKERQAALNWIVPRTVYEIVGPFVDVGIAYDTEYCDRMAKAGIPVVCLKPSYIQNIGHFGAYQSDASYVAPDYVGKMEWTIRGWNLGLALKAKLLSRSKRFLLR